MDPATKDALHQLNEHLNSGSQAWLFGAGISLCAGIPLMDALTERVFKRAEEDGEPGDKETLDAIKNELIKDFHIEHVLSQIGDYRAIADRTKNKKAKIGSKELPRVELDAFHARIVNWIAETVRWGYRAKTGSSPESVGKKAESIVSADDHIRFATALFNSRQMGIADRRKAVRLFTTNYDTLIEDALALSSVSYWDGFSGGAVAFRNYRYGEEEPSQGFRAHVIKLHGSIDWHLGMDGKLWRVRDCDIYPEKEARVIIYPQSIKYLATQRDPFAAQFDLLRRSLSSRDENVFAICGYSFGDDHINQEIELAMERPDNKSTIIAFTQDLNDTVSQWCKRPWGKRLYAITKDGLYVGEDGPFAAPASGHSWNWWTFQGATQILEEGPEACVR